MSVIDFVENIIDRITTRDIVTITLTALLTYGTIKGIFPPEGTLPLIGIVIGYWFKTNGNGKSNGT